MHFRPDRSLRAANHRTTGKRGALVANFHKETSTMTTLTPGTDLCRCTACGLSFKSTSAFAAHRRGDFTREAPHYGRRCLTADELTAKGYAPNERGFWRGARPSHWVSDQQAA